MVRLAGAVHIVSPRAQHGEIDVALLSRTTIAILSSSLFVAKTFTFA